MKKVIIGLGLFALVAGVFFISYGAKAEESGAYLEKLTPDGYAYAEPEGCLTCAHQSSGWKKNTHLENAIGIKNATDTHGVSEGKTVELTGKGWMASDHATSQDLGSSARNYYCGWCHSPGDEKVVNDSADAKGFKKKDMSQGMSCKGCHPTNTINRTYNTRYGNLQPGTDYNDAANWKLVPKDADGHYDGKKSNAQCLYCHGERHGFAVSIHENMVKKGDLRCFDCHMPVFNTLASGLHEVNHNMKIAANENPNSCTPCHSFKKGDMLEKVAKLMGGHTQKKHTLPSN